MTEVQTEVQATEEGATVDNSPQVIAAVNPTPEEMTALREHISENYNFDVAVKDIEFRFKKSKDKETGLETIREPLQLAIPTPSIQGIVAILEAGGKQAELLMDVVETTVVAQARAMITEDLSLNAANFPVEKLSWEAIANMPKAARRGGGIPKDTWDAFGTDYIEVMMSAVGKTADQAGRAAKILTGKLQAVKTNMEVLPFMVEQLGIYAENTQNLEDFQECVEFLVGKADEFMNADPADLLANL